MPLITLKDEQPKSIVIFLDRTHGNLIREKLIDYGFEVRACSRMFPEDTPDVEWIAECAKQDWVILSGDKAIEEVPAERQAVIDGKCRVFMFDDTTSKSEEWLAALLVGRQRLLHLAANADGPFFVTIRKFGYSHFSLPRFIPGTGAGWRPEHKDLKPPEPAQQTRKKGKPSQQRRFWEENETGS